MIARLLDELLDGAPVSDAAVAEALDLALGGDLSDARLAALLIALRTRRPGGTLLAAAARAVRRRAVPLPLDEATRNRAIDVCGTGGDGAQTFNVSTAAGLLAAACGATVAKHGNRAVSSRSGSADVVLTLGLPLDRTPREAAGALARDGFAFLLAPAYHPSLARVARVRRDLGVRTLFNLLGPLASPARARRQLVGVWSPELTEPVAEALLELGCERGLVVHAGGLDELACHAPAEGFRVEDGRLRPFRLDPAELDLVPAPPSALAAAGPGASAARVIAALAGTDRAAADAVALNAGAALFVAGLAEDVARGLALARSAQESGAALGFLETLRGAEVRP